MKKLQTLVLALGIVYSQDLSEICKPHELVSMLENRYKGGLADEKEGGIDEQIFVIDVPSQGAYAPKIRLDFIIEASGNRKIFVRYAAVPKDKSLRIGYEYDRLLDPGNGSLNDIYEVTEENGDEKRALVNRSKRFVKEFRDQFSAMINRAYAHLTQNVTKN